MTIKFTAEEMRYIASFEGLTGARVRDCIINDFGGSVTFVVDKGEFGMAVGRGGDKVRRARRVIGRGIEIVEYSDDPVEFVKNALLPARVQSAKIVEKGGKKIAVVTVWLLWSCRTKDWRWDAGVKKFKWRKNSRKDITA